MLLEIVRQDIELLMEDRLRHRLEGHFHVLCKRALVRYLDGGKRAFGTVKRSFGAVQRGFAAV